MLSVFANIEISNRDDAADFERGWIDKDKIRQIFVQSKVNSDSMVLCINEKIREFLGLRIIGTRLFQNRDGSRTSFPVATGVSVRFKNRNCLTNALVLPGNETPIFGKIPLTAMDLKIHPTKNELVGVHPEGWITVLK